MERQNMIETVTVEEAMQAMSEALRWFAEELSETLDDLVNDDCRQERQLMNGMSDLDEQLKAVKDLLKLNDSFKCRRLVLRDVVERYRGDSDPLDKLLREIGRLLHKDYGQLCLSSEALCRESNAGRRSPT
jgi:hypothetical protein